jgi:transposase-like protein
VNGSWRYVYRAIDQHGPVIDVLLSARRDATAARGFHPRTTRAQSDTDAAPVYPAVLDELVPTAWHHVEQYANNPIQADHGQLKRRLRPMRGLQTDRTAQVVIAGHTFIQISCSGKAGPRDGRRAVQGRGARRAHVTRYSQLLRRR